MLRKTVKNNLGVPRLKQESISSSSRAIKGICLLVVVAYVLIVFGGHAIRMASLRVQVARLQEQIEYHQAHNEILKRRIEAMESDEYIERIAREQLGFVRQGEVIYVRVDSGPSASP